MTLETSNGVVLGLDVIFEARGGFVLGLVPVLVPVPLLLETTNPILVFSLNIDKLGFKFSNSLAFQINGSLHRELVFHQRELYIIQLVNLKLELLNFLQSSTQTPDPSPPP